MTQDIATSAYRLYNEGCELERQGHWKQAEAVYREVVSLPEAPPDLALGSWFRIGCCLEQTGTVEDAIAAYYRAIDLPQVSSESGAHLLHRLGLALQRSGQYHESGRHLEAVLALLPVSGLSRGEVQAVLSRSRILAGEPQDPPPAMSRQTEDFLDRYTHARNKLSTIIPQEVLKGGRYLDIGCGVGAGVLAAAELGAALSAGIDRDLKEFGESPFADVARAKGLSLAATLLLEGDAFSINFGPPGFDVAMMLDVIEHVPGPLAFIQFAHRVLRPGGLLLIDTCPLYYSPVGHHIWSLAPRHELPWVHLYHDAEERLAALNLNEWQRVRFAELNRVTHAQVRGALAQAGFSLLMEHESQPKQEDLALYEKFGHLIDSARVPEKADLFRDWALFLARKT